MSSEGQPLHLDQRKVDFEMGLRLGIRQNKNKALTDSHQKDAKFVIFLVQLDH